MGLFRFGQTDVAVRVVKLIVPARSVIWRALVEPEDRNDLAATLVLRRFKMFADLRIDIIRLPANLDSEYSIDCLGNLHSLPAFFGGERVVLISVSEVSPARLMEPDALPDRVLLG